MKPITFESIRNFITTKKRHKKDGTDTSFKRSDSFKRISIRKSYLDRGRNKRSVAAMRATSLLSTASAAVVTKPDADVAKITVQIHQIGDDALTASETEKRPSGSHTSHVLCTDQYLDAVDEHPKTDNQNGYGGEDDNTDVIVCSKSTKKSQNDQNNVIDGRFSTYTAQESDGEINYPSTDKSNESLYEHVGNPSVHSASADERPKLSTSSDVYAMFSIYGDNNSTIPTATDNNHLLATRTNHMLSDNISDSAVYTQKHEQKLSQSTAPATSSNINSMYVNYDTSTSEITFKTFVQPKLFLETSFDSVEPLSLLQTSIPTLSIAAQSTNATVPVELSQSPVENIASKKINISRTSLNTKMSRTDGIFESHTPRMLNSPITNQSESVVIRIPGIEPPDRSLATLTPLAQSRNYSSIQLNATRLPWDMDDIAHSQDELETSLNGKLTFEIYKELQKSPENEVSCSKRSALTLSNCQFRPSECDKLCMSLNSGIKDDGTDDNIDNESFFEHLLSDSIDVDNLATRLSSLQLHTYNHGLPSVDDVLPPSESVIPHSVRLKPNPFTRQKELYTVNLGRIWKNLNLGQADIRPDDNNMQGRFKKKNESFKSMSSQDSGFSLTLTKPKSLYRKRSNKRRGTAGHSTTLKAFDVNQWQRNGNRDPQSYYIKSSARRNKKPTKIPQTRNQNQQLIAGDYNDLLGQYYAGNAFDSTLTQTFDRSNPWQHPMSGSSTGDKSSATESDKRIEDTLFVKEFEQFCISRKKKTDRENSESFIDVKLFTANTSAAKMQLYDEAPLESSDVQNMQQKQFGRPRSDTFTKEINDLEAFFEEHLKRLKEYYLHKKRLTNRKLDQLCFDTDACVLTNGDYRIFDEQKHDSDVVAEYQKDFSFPYPDKRSVSGRVNKPSSASVSSTATRWCAWAPEHQYKRAQLNELHQCAMSDKTFYQNKNTSSNSLLSSSCELYVNKFAHSTSSNASLSPKCRKCCLSIDQKKSVMFQLYDNDEFSQNKFDDIRNPNDLGLNGDKALTECSCCKQNVDEFCRCQSCDNEDTDGRLNLVLPTGNMSARKIKRKKTGKRCSAKNFSTLRQIYSSQAICKNTYFT